MLSVRDLRSGYGKIEVLHNITMTIEHGQIVTLIGANGAGKTTLLKTISGFIRPTAAQSNSTAKISCRAPTRDHRPRHQPGARRTRHPQAHDGHRQPAHRRLCAQRFARSTAISRRCLNAFRPWPNAATHGGTLSGGEQQMLAIGRALVARPRLLLLDEPSLGLAPKFITLIFQTLRELKAKARPFCWSSRTPAKPFRSQTAPTSWNGAILL